MPKKGYKQPQSVKDAKSKSLLGNKYALGKKPSAETKEKMRLAHLGKKPSEETLKKLRVPKKSTENYHKPKSEEHKRKISESNIGRHHSKKATEINREKHIGKTPWNKDIELSEDHRRKISESHIGKQCGDKNPNWNGGSSFEPYCPKFTKEFKDRVRAFFGYVCQGCNTPQGKNLLDVHHVNFKKDACCDSQIIPLFIPLCRKCHTATNNNRSKYEKIYTDLINTKYNGKCYFTKEESDEKKREKMVV